MLAQLPTWAAAALTWAFGTLFPKAPEAVVTLITVLFAEVADFVEDLAEYNGMSGPEKMEYLKTKVVEFAAEAFDDLPYWGSYPEDRQLVIIEGWAETAVFLMQARDEGVKAGKIKRKARRAARKLVVPADA